MRLLRYCYDAADFELHASKDLVDEEQDLFHVFSDTINDSSYDAPRHFLILRGFKYLSGMPDFLVEHQEKLTLLIP